jgi:hypothetical protein
VFLTSWVSNWHPCLRFSVSYIVNIKLTSLSEVQCFLHREYQTDIPVSGSVFLTSWISNWHPSEVQCFLHREYQTDIPVWGSVFLTSWISNWHPCLRYSVSYIVNIKLTSLTDYVFFFSLKSLQRCAIIRFNIQKLPIWPLRSHLPLRLVLRLNLDCLLKRHKPTDICNEDKECFLRGRNRTSKNYLAVEKKFETKLFISS